MTYTEFLVLRDLQDSCQFRQLLEKYGKFGIYDKFKTYSNKFIVVDDDGHCHLFDMNGNEYDINEVKSIENWAFNSCTSLTSISIPDSAESIGDGAFYNCTSLTSISIPDSVKSIELKAFYNCISLKSILIPGSVKSLGYGVFDGCASLTSILISNSVKNIETAAFCNCTSLTSISISDSVERIGKWAFVHCASLKKVVFKGKTMNQVKAMDNYPWGIENKSIFKAKK